FLFPCGVIGPARPGPKPLDAITSKKLTMAGIAMPRGNMRRPTFAEIAASAGVSLATAERVLNGRGGVSRGKVQQVITAAQQLGYDRRLPDIHPDDTLVDIRQAPVDMFEQL